MSTSTPEIREDHTEDSHTRQLVYGFYDEIKSIRDRAKAGELKPERYTEELFFQCRYIAEYLHKLEKTGGKGWAEVLGMYAPIMQYVLGLSRHLLKNGPLDSSQLDKAFDYYMLLQFC